MKLKFKIKIKNSLGLHVRPAAAIVKLLQHYRSSVFFTYKKETVNAKSIMSILMLVAKKNAQLEITIEGDDAELAAEQLKNGFETSFGE